MPRFKRRRFRRRKRYNGLWKLRKQVKAIAGNTELKHYDGDGESLVAEPQGTAWGRENLNAPIIIGNTYLTRVGNEYKMKRLSIKGYFENSRGTPQDCMIRMIVFRAKFQNNADQTNTLLYQDPTDMNTFREMTHKGRYKIYFDQRFCMRSSTEDNAQTYLPIRLNIPLNSKVVCSGNAGTYADIERNGLWIMLCSNVPASANCPILYYNYRITYYDS